MVTCEALLSVVPQFQGVPESARVFSTFPFTSPVARAAQNHLIAIIISYPSSPREAPSSATSTSMSLGWERRCHKPSA